MNILFLDYDGVVNTPMWNEDGTRCTYNFLEDNKVNNFQACQWISEFCQKYKYDIVVSSTWRRSDNYKDCLTNGGLRTGVQILGKTPEAPRHDHWCRGEEIQSYIDEHSDIENFIIVDDDRDMGSLIDILYVVILGKVLR